MEQLNIFPTEFISPIYRCLHLLKNCEIHIFNRHRSSKRFTWNSLLVFISMIAYHSSLSVNLILLFKGKIKLVELSYIISIYVVCTQSILKISIVSLNKKRIRSIIQQLGAIWTKESLTEVQINKKNVLLKRLKFCYTVFYWMNLIGSWQYMLAPILETLIRRYILQQDCELLLPFACSFPFNPTGNWLMYIGVYIFEIYSMFRIVFCYLGTEFLMITLCSHLATEFALLNEDLNNIEPGKSRDFDKLRPVLVKHQKLICLAKQLDTAFNKMIFVNLLSANITICFFGFSAKVAKGVFDMASNFTAVVALILPLFNLCYYSELLRESSANIGNSAYDHLWYRGSIRYQKMMWLIIRRSQKPCSLSSLKYNPIALHTFTTVLSTTWSYFSLASSLYEGEG